MRILLTGGASDLATVLTPFLEQRGDTVLRLDIRAPQATGGVHLPGSILNRACLAKAFTRSFRNPQMARLSTGL